MRSKKGQIALNSLWILLDIPGIMLGCLTGLGIFLAGKKVGEKRWKVTGLIYCILLLVLEVVGLSTSGKISDNIGMCFVILDIIAMIHSVVILIQFIPRFSRMLDGYSDVQTAKVEANTSVVAPTSFSVSKDLYSVANSSTPEKKANISFDNSYYNSLNLTASAISTKTTDIENERPNFEKIDINTCSEKELSSLPGVSVVAAKKAISYREKNGGFASEEEFYKVLGIQLHFIRQIKDKIICGNNIIASTEQTQARNLIDEPETNTLEDKVASTREKKGRVLDI